MERARKDFWLGMLYYLLFCVICFFVMSAIKDAMGDPVYDGSYMERPW